MSDDFVMAIRKTIGIPSLPSLDLTHLNGSESCISRLIGYLISNSINQGLKATFAGILGITSGVFIVAMIAATGLGALLAVSTIAYNVLKIAGAIYLVYLGIKLWRTKQPASYLTNKAQPSLKKAFFQGHLISLFNPKAIVFFVSIFPQFIDIQRPAFDQCLLLASSFCLLIVIVHTAYALMVMLAKNNIKHSIDNSGLNKISGGLFIALGVATASR